MGFPRFNTRYAFALVGNTTPDFLRAKILGARISVKGNSAREAQLSATQLVGSQFRVMDKRELRGELFRAVNERRAMRF